MLPRVCSISIMPWRLMQVVSCMGEIYIDLGNVLIFFYTIWVWVLQRIAEKQKPFLIGYCWTNSFCYWHCTTILCGLQRQANIQDDLQALSNCYAVSFPSSCPILLRNTCQFYHACPHTHFLNLCITFCRYLKSHFIIDFLGCLPWDIIYGVLIFVNIIVLLFSLNLTHAIRFYSLLSLERPYVFIIDLRVILYIYFP